MSREIRFIRCATPGCERPAREVGVWTQCRDCDSQLCEKCCDAKKRAARGGK